MPKTTTIRASNTVLLTVATVLIVTGIASAQDAAINAHTDTYFQWGVAGTSDDYDGVYGYSDGAGLADHGVRGRTNSTATAEAGVYGSNDGQGPGVYGVGVYSETGYGVRATASAAHAVYGDSNSAIYGHYGGWFSGNHGLYAQSEGSGTDALHAECFAGGNCWGADIGGDSYGVYANTNNASGNYGLYTPDNIYSANFHSLTGLSIVARSEENFAPLLPLLGPGDVVAVTGLGPPLPGSRVPTPIAQRASAHSASGIMGVVETAYEVEMVKRPKVTFVKKLLPSPEGGERDEIWVSEVDEEHRVPIHRSVEGPVEPGGLMVVKILGLAQVRTVATAAGVRAGEALGFSKSTGLDLASAATDEESLVIGHALESLPPGATGLVWALVGVR